MPVDPPVSAQEAPARDATREYRWYHKAFALVFIVFCMEVGVVLLVMPWSEYWENNFFSTWTPHWSIWWRNEYVRGAVSGLGLVNICIAFGELLRMRRFHEPPSEPQPNR